jgi:hypothetical protein
MWGVKCTSAVRSGVRAADSPRDEQTLVLLAELLEFRRTPSVPADAGV